MPSVVTVRAQQGDTLDLVCWRHYGRTAGVTEAALTANPGIADLGAILPLGTKVVMPAVEPRESQTPSTVRLWD